MTIPPPPSARRPWTPFEHAVAAAVRSIPRGQTASYARVALMVGKPGASRAVVRALKAVDGVPWWRVLRADGTLAPQVAGEQARHLRREGVVLIGRRVVPAGQPKKSSTSRQSDSRRAGRKKPK